MTEKINSIRDKICSFLQEGKGHVSNIKGLKFNPGCIPTIHVWGNRAERASSVGKFGRPIVSSMYHLLFKKAVTEILTWQEPQKLTSRILLMASRHFYQIASRLLIWPRLPEDLRQEISIYAKNAGASRQFAMFALLLGEFDMFLTYRGCSTMAATAPLTRDGQLVMGRNLDFDSFGLADVLHILQVNHPSEPDEIPSAWLSWLGFWGTFTGWNRAGLALGCMVVNNAKNDDIPNLKARSCFTPMAWAYTKILRKCRTVEEGIGLLRTMTPLGPNNIMLADSTGHAVVVEWSTNRMQVRQIENGFLVATNGFRSREMFEVEDTCDRYENAEAFLTAQHNDGIDGMAMRKALDLVNQGELTLHSAIFEPNRRKVHIAINPPPSTRGIWHELPWDVWENHDLIP